MGETGQDKKLKDAWVKFEAELAKKGETLPSMEQGSNYRDGKRIRKPIYLADLGRSSTSVFGQDKTQTLEDFLSKIRILSAVEQLVIVEKYYYGQSYRQIVKELKFTSGVAGVKRIHDKAIQKLREGLSETN